MYVHCTTYIYVYLYRSIWYSIKWQNRRIYINCRSIVLDNLIRVCSAISLNGRADFKQRDNGSGPEDRRHIQGEGWIRCREIVYIENIRQEIGVRVNV